MIVKVLKAQENKPSKGDWFSTVINDINEFNLNLTTDDIKKLSKTQLKNRTKKAMIKTAFENLINDKDTKQKSKLKSLKYDKLKIQKYLKTNKITIKRKIVLFKARTRMLNVLNNFGQHAKCPLCKIKEDDQTHLLDCLIIKINCPEILNNMNSKYEDIFSDNVDKQSEICRLVDIAIKKRNELMKTD